MSATHSPGPVGNVPYELLEEIFIYCGLDPEPQLGPDELPPAVSSHRPSAKAAPMLFCQPDGPQYYRRVLKKKDTEFIRWWRCNHGTMAPALSFQLEGVLPQKELPQNSEILDWDGMDFILQYITTAPCLDLGAFFWERISERLQMGIQDMYPNLRVVLFESTYPKADYVFYTVQAALGLIPSNPTPRLQRLSINSNRLYRNESSGIPLHWSTLTHLSFCDGPMSFDFWYSLMRAAPFLKMGYFSFTLMSDSTMVSSAKYTLAHLVELHIDVCADNFSGDLANVPPAAPSPLPWWDHRAVGEVDQILTTAPNLTSLILGEDFLSFDSPEFVWSRATHLEHSELVLPYDPFDTVEDVLKILLQNVFFPENRWLNLESSNCPIREIRIFTEHSMGIDSDLLQTSLCDLVSKTPRITYRFAQESLWEKAGRSVDKWGSIH
ncbi:hypothetical protein BDN70DRAFT_895113 [Pholiota conissans]|uniref:Uncharacterized protein n=1 Tax=Pholiota conissans TaxID=109636 RepID=A0A9P5Z4E4_9AGAR|nr:hypothetical protein BDN70DRAFT_895113 [Pholiota conissans]